MLPGSSGVHRIPSTRAGRLIRRTRRFGLYTLDSTRITQIYPNSLLLGQRDLSRRVGLDQPLEAPLLM